MGSAHALIIDFADFAQIIDFAGSAQVIDFAGSARRPAKGHWTLEPSSYLAWISTRRFNAQASSLLPLTAGRSLP